MVSVPTINLGMIVTPDHRELTEGLRLAGVAIVSAVVVASAVIAAGEAAQRHHATDAPHDEPALLIRTSS